MNIVIVDPIFRASRLQYSYMVAKKAKELNFKVHIITRVGAFTEQYKELFNDIEHTLYEIVSVPEEFWFGKISKNGIKTMLSKLSELHTNIELKAMYFSGGHEIFPEIATDFLLERYKNLRSLPIVMIDYEPDFLLPRRETINFKEFKKSIMNKLHIWKVYWLKKRKYEKLFNSFTNLHIGVLDERIKSEKVNKHFFYLPDPSPDISQTKMKTNQSDEKINILIVGLQTGRKGFQEIIKLLNKYENDLDEVSFLFAGRLDDDTKKFKLRLTKSHILKWEEGYFSEEKICAFYDSSDYVIMPYSTQFHGSSGVMAYAAAFNKPMITTSHGCIGYRNKQYNMGYTYDYTNIESLYSLIKNLPKRDSIEYNNLKNSCEIFYKEHSVLEHQKKIFEKLGIGNIV